MYSTSEVASRLGIHRDTLLRWLREGKVAEPSRDRRGWRLFSERDLSILTEFTTSSGDVQIFDTDSSLKFNLPRDFDFTASHTTYLTHSLHPYPAKFIPQIPNALIDAYSRRGECVLDPFCGSGTTLVESMLLGRHAIGIDANPIAVLIARAKTSRLGPEHFSEIEAHIRSLPTSSAELRQLSLLQEVTLSEPSTSEDIRFWFDNDTLEELQFIVSATRSLSEDARIVAQTALSSIVVKVSRQDSDTRYVRREKNIKPGDTLNAYQRALREAMTKLSEAADIYDPSLACNVFQQSVLDSWPNVKADLVVSSPPYPNAWSYHLYHRLRMLIFGIDNAPFKSNEIGSHRKYSAKGARRATAETFLAEMTTVFSNINRALPRGRFACMVIGDSIIDGHLVDNSQILEQAADRSRFRLSDSLDRTVNAQRKSFNPSIGKIKTEKILIFQKTNDV